jgi:hypothetical protein
MTKHKAIPEQWAADRYDWARADTEALDGNSAFRCIMELRSRVEALEGAQRPTVKDSLTVPADSLTGRQPWAAMRFRGVTLLPPIDCADPDSWIADRIYEMGLADGRNATTGNTAPVTRDRAEDAPESSDSLVELVASAISGCGNVGPIKWWTPEARAAILTVVDWLDQQELHTTAARLRQEVG